jgi:fatty acid desaturase
MDLLDLLGSMVATPGSTASQTIGAMIHHANGALLAIAWAYGAALVGLPANWLTAIGWGVILWALALLMMSTIGAVHPAIRTGEQEDPGPAATNFGAMTPVGSLMGHLVYGLVLGLAYQSWPLG